MQIAEAVCIYNLKSGKRAMGGQFFHTFGVPAVSFQEFMSRSTDLLTAHTAKVIACGGDGTAFEVLKAIAQLPAHAEVDVLALGTGTANVLARKQGTLYQPETVFPLIEDFLAGALAAEPIAPVQYRVADQGVYGDAFWGVGVGAIAPLLLRYLEQFRSVKDPSWRKFFALLALLASETKGQPFGIIDRKAVAGWDLAFISHVVPYWPAFIPVREVCASEHGDAQQVQPGTQPAIAAVEAAGGVSLATPERPDDYLLRFGKEGQLRCETYAWLFLDLLALRMLKRTVSGTLYAQPIAAADVELFAREPNLTVDSELVPLERRGKVVIERLNASEKPQIRLAHR